MDTSGIDGGPNRAAEQRFDQNGEGGSYRWMRQDLPPMQAGLTPIVTEYHKFVGEGSTYRPTKRGAIGCINYSASRINFEINGQSRFVIDGIALFQVGFVYKHSLVDFSDNDWTMIEKRGLRREDFSSDQGGIVDFSKFAAEIQFGYYRSITGSNRRVIVEHGMDDWRLEILPMPNPGCPS